MGFRRAGLEKLLLTKCRRYPAKKNKPFPLGRISRSILTKIKEDGIKGRYKIDLCREDDFISCILRMSYVLLERHRKEAMRIKLGLHATGGTLSKVCPQRAFSKRLRTCSNCRPNRCCQPTGEDITYSQSKPHRQTSHREPSTSAFLFSLTFPTGTFGVDEKRRQICR